MSDAYIQITPDSNGKKIDNSLLTVGGQSVYRQRVEVYSGETLPVSSGSDTVLGTTSDAAVSTDTTGTVSGKLRGLVKILSNVWDSVSRLRVTAQHDLDAVSPFGDLITAPITPSTQMDFIYGINTQTGVSTTANGGTVDTNAGRLRLQTGTNTAGSAIFRSRRPARYRAGQGIVARFTTVFTTGVASSTQFYGPGSADNGYMVGFNGTAFGILHRNGGSDNWIAQTSWNGDKCNGSGLSGFNLNPTFGNVWMVKYPFLGYGVISFWVLNPATARWILCHTIQYPNTTATIQITNPSLYFYGQVLNSGNNTNLLSYCASVGFFLCGERAFQSAPKWAADSNKTGITTETNLLTLKNATTYNGVTNTAIIRLNQISWGTSAAAGIATLRFKIGATLGGSPSYTTINGTTADAGVTITSGNSITSYDTAGTTVTGGTYIYNASQANGSGGEVIDLTPFGFFVAPGETLTVSLASTVSTTGGVSLNWTEDI
jgi:hypothetical protein